MRKQAGLTLITMVLLAIVLGLCFVLTMKLIPVYSEYFGVKSTLKALVKEKAGAPVGDIRESFMKRAEIEYIKSVRPDDLDIVQGDGSTTIGVTYDANVPLIANATLVLHFEVEEKSAPGAAQ
ncbi:DUF4845 domain-containing protein [Chitinimonas sp. BJB300]|uniref:DUF4845 domain-containing protein n=1 Tax=Chitinimonas sp. BJB300 TaxID=1559339 RepID=UPI000C0E096A|nr:DUF4845 domain-containing protein [Chitinimonas sp. BJB300]PHV11574.1 hypothetical protein CSQ89_10250 [Chitinimonas sp. BJB300]TSJ88968.1 DUF4845 domain-containing protein [Chitinimonas sp. BJB300]